ncbi:DMT family transporter [Archangium violaceum]|uniref:DMT family transporter n=1 Tax=Archangium violaceum TaxID=83451 RepID=UPI0019515D09|nr:DMT family transporter [Archangium violaceum]QRN99437.1 DMT family transporter [Archangium violaceum]
MSSPSSSPTNDTSRFRADGALLLITAFWGTTFVVVKGALGHGDPYSFLTLRFTLGALALTAVARRQMLVPQTLRRGLLLGVFLFLGFVLQTVGLVSTTPSRSAFITGLYVVFVPLLGLALFRRMPRVTSWVGVVLAAVGLRYLTGADVGEGGLSSGDWLTLGCAVAYALHILLTERYAPKSGVVPLVAVQLWVVAVLSALCLPFTETRVEWAPIFIVAVAFCGLIASAMALCVQTWAQARTTAVRVALICSMEPVFTAVYSVGLGYEMLGVREWVGGGLIVSGVLVAELGGHLLGRLRARGAAEQLPDV